MKKLTTVFLITLLLIGCTPRVIITPDKLPDAIVGELYYAEIEITGGTGPVTASGFNSISTSDFLWVEPNPKREGGFYNSLIVQGKPRTTGNIIIKIKGGMIPALFFGEAKFEKTYIIKVKESE